MLKEGVLNFFKIRKLYSPDPESGKFENFFFLKCIIANIFRVANFTLE